MKHEIKIELDNSDLIEELITKTYFANNSKGKITNNDMFINVYDNDIVNHTICKGLHNTTIKVVNEKIDGFMRFIIDESNNDIRLYPTSIYCIKEDKYIFY